MKIKQKLTTSNKSKGVNTCDYIVLHHTATVEGSIAGVLRTLTVGMVSCHYVVDTNGDIYQIGEDTDILWHAGVSSWEGKEDMNRYSIGIEIIGPLKDGGFTDEQRTAVRGLVLELMERHGIGKRQVIRHKDISPGRKIDVKDSFWNGQHKTFAQYQDALTEENTSSTTMLEASMPIQDLHALWIAHVQPTDRKFKDYSLDGRIKYLIDLGK